ncbi:MAG: response regulator transcription factor [Chloroflexota bacterium]|nr:MAG: response regulator transcription factor [Chloroflexota bacterium]UCF26821.1 MAG: response regulator transcription factor [Chloroflexota bacterium]
MQALLFSPHIEEASVLSLLLQRAGFYVRTVHNLEQAIDAWPEKPADFVLITLPEDISKAIKYIEDFRLYTVIPICIISDPVNEGIQVELLEAGADLVIQRPYGIRFLHAQIKSLLRRSAGIPFFSLPTLSQQDVVLDPSMRTVKVGNHPEKHLTQLEFRLLYTLMTNVGQILPTEQIVEHVWGYSGEGNRDLVRGLVQRLRSKVEPEPRNPRYILTESGIGYYFNRSE